MPRVTQSHRDRQTARILDAAEACFARRGFRAASMDEIIAEAGMSSATVYRYFPQGKESLVAAVLERTTDPVIEWLAALVGRAELPDPHEALLEGVTRCLSIKGLGSGDGEASVVEGRGAALLVHSWAELAPDSPTRRVDLERYRMLRSHMTTLVSRWQEEGRVTGALTAPRVAEVIHRMVLGLIVERALFGQDGGEGIDAAVRSVSALLAPRPRSADEGSLGGHADDPAPVPQRQRARGRHRAHAADEHQRRDHVLGAVGQQGRDPGGQAHGGEGADDLEEHAVQRQIGHLQQEQGGHPHDG